MVTATLVMNLDGQYYEVHSVENEDYCLAVESCIGFWLKEGKPLSIIRIRFPDGQVRCRTVGGERQTWSEIKNEKRRRYKRFSLN